jgi:putative DNA primase/helicase
VLAGVDTLTILGETDDGGANDRAVRECFARWNAAGREVYRATSTASGDMNDGLMVA